MKHVVFALLIGGVVACGGSEPKPDSVPSTTNVVGGDCPACTSPNFDGLPPGGSARGADDLPYEGETQVEPAAAPPSDDEDSH